MLLSDPIADTNTREHSMKLRKERCFNRQRRNFFRHRIVNRWNMLAENIVTPPSIHIFKKTIRCLLACSQSDDFARTRTNTSQDQLAGLRAEEDVCVRVCMYVYMYTIELINNIFARSKYSFFAGEITCSYGEILCAHNDWYLYLAAFSNVLQIIVGVEGSNKYHVLGTVVAEKCRPIHRLWLHGKYACHVICFLYVWFLLFIKHIQQSVSIIFKIGSYLIVN